MKTKVYKACKEYIESYKDIDDIRLNVDTYVNILLRKHPKTPVELLMKPACIEYVADGNLAEYPDTQFDDLVEIFKNAGEKFKYEVYLKKPICDEIKKYGFDTWHEKYNNLAEHYEHFKQKGTNWIITLWYREIIGAAILRMIQEHE